MASNMSEFQLMMEKVKKQLCGMPLDPELVAEDVSDFASLLSALSKRLSARAKSESAQRAKFDARIAPLKESLERHGAAIPTMMREILERHLSQLVELRDSTNNGGPGESELFELMQQRVDAYLNSLDKAKDQAHRAKFDARIAALTRHLELHGDVTPFFVRMCIKGHLDDLAVRRDQPGVDLAFEKKHEAYEELLTKPRCDLEMAHRLLTKDRCFFKTAHQRFIKDCTVLDAAISGEGDEESSEDKGDKISDTKDRTVLEGESYEDCENENESEDEDEDEDCESDEDCEGWSSDEGDEISEDSTSRKRLADKARRAIESRQEGVLLREFTDNVCELCARAAIMQPMKTEYERVNGECPTTQQVWDMAQQKFGLMHRFKQLRTNHWSYIDSMCALVHNRPELVKFIHSKAYAKEVLLDALSTGMSRKDRKFSRASFEDSLAKTASKIASGLVQSKFELTEEQEAKEREAKEEAELKAAKKVVKEAQEFLNILSSGISATASPQTGYGLFGMLRTN